MEKLIVYGGRKLNGELEICSAKNSLLPILAGSIINNGKVIIKSVPKFSDVINMVDILKSLGCVVEWQEDDLIIDNSTMDKYIITEGQTKKVRASIFMLGPLLSRLKKAKVAYPGGCNIGNRPIDLHIKGLKSLNVKIQERHGYIYCDGSNMKAAEINLEFPSVGATENLIMASIFLSGRTIIRNAAREPEIVDLQNFLNSMGCKVYGAGGDIIEIIGVEKLNDTEYLPIKDRIIAGTYMIACAMCGGNIKLLGCEKKDNIALIEKLINCGVEVNENKYSIEISTSKKIRCIPMLETQVYPGFPTDLQNQILTMQTISKGTSVIVENLFENRFGICSELSKMGADILVKDRMALVKGVDRLYGANVVAKDLRGGASLVLAGLVADGYTTIENIYHIDRGYMSIEEDFCKLNGEIERINK